MDRKVYISFGVTITVLLFLLLLRMFGEETCQDLKFLVPSRVETGAPASFYDNTAGAEKWHWDFGDKVGTSVAQRAEYTYEKPGTYYVQLQVNGKCTETREVLVVDKPPPSPVETLPEEVPTTLGPTTIQAPVSVEVNKPVPFSIKGKDILSSEWSFGESGKTDSRETSPTYTYQEPGTYTVTLIVNGRNDAFVTHLIKVKPKPRAVVTTSGISEAQFKKNLQNRVDYGVFKPHICNNNDIQVTINNGEKMGFFYYYRQLLIMNDITVTNVRLVRNQTTHCITAIHITQTE